MQEASQRERIKGGSAYAKCMEPALESCMNSDNKEKIQRIPALTVQEVDVKNINQGGTAELSVPMRGMRVRRFLRYENVIT